MGIDMVLPGDVISTIERLEAAGYEAWAVGGCVRDSLIGRAPKDYDIASLCPPAIVRALFPRCVKTGEAYGTVTVLTPSMPIEVTIFRLESGYRDNRHPQSVSPASDIEIDLSRRDFTINAMAWHPKRGLCDPFGGQGDLESGIVRAVGDPYVRFSEDALRILRCLRFASQLDFDIDSNTLEAVKKLAPSLESISVERITAELNRLLTGERPELAAILIESGGLAHCGIRQINNPSLLRKIPSSLPLRLAALLWLGLDDLSNTNIQSFLRRLRMDHHTIHSVGSLLSLMRNPLPTDAVALKWAFSILPPDRWEGLLAMRSVLTGEDTDKVSYLLKEVSRQPWNRAMLAISGDDLLKLGYNGRQVGRVLSLILEQVLYDPELNTKERLLKIAGDINPPPV